MKVLPNMASVVDIKAVSYDVCGVVRMVSSGYRAKVKQSSVVPLLATLCVACFY